MNLAGSDSSSIAAPIIDNPHNPRTPIPTAQGQRRFLFRRLGGRAQGSGG